MDKEEIIQKALNKLYKNPQQAFMDGSYKRVKEAIIFTANEMEKLELPAAASNPTPRRDEDLIEKIEEFEKKGEIWYDSQLLEYDKNSEIRFKESEWQQFKKSLIQQLKSNCSEKPTVESTPFEPSSASEKKLDNTIILDLKLKPQNFEGLEIMKKENDTNEIQRI